MEKFPSKCGTDLLKGLNVLDAIYWINHAWNAVEASTISKCFDKCGFNKVRIETDENASDDIDENVDDDDDVPLSVLKLSKELFGCEFSELANIERNIPTCDTNQIDWDRHATELLNLDDKSDDDDENSDSETVVEEASVCSVSEAFSYIDSLKDFACASGNSKMLDCVMELSALATGMRVQCSTKQTKISDFFKK